MKRFMAGAMLLFALFAMASLPLLALAQAAPIAGDTVSVIAQPPMPGQSPEQLLVAIQQAFAGGRWVEVAALSVLLLVFLIGKFWGVWQEKPELKPYLKWVAVGSAALMGGASAMLSGMPLPAALAAAVASAVTSGLMAIGANEALLKPLQGLLSPTEKARQAVMAQARVAVSDGSLRLHESGGLIIRGEFKPVDTAAQVG